MRIFVGFLLVVIMHFAAVFGFAGAVYALSTTEGSVYQMERMLRSEKGKRCVGGKQ